MIKFACSHFIQESIADPNIPASHKTAIVAVTNDLTTDQRVDRTCLTLTGMGYKVLLTGRRRRDSLTLTPRAYRTHRMRLIFGKGPLFYAEYNLNLFFLLAFRRYDLVVSNDLDTLPATWFAHQVRRSISVFRFDGKTAKPVHIHDCHEYFRGVPELVGRSFAPKIWKMFEDHIYPRLRYVTAVNDSIAGLYSAEYGNTITVMRNVPFRKALTPATRRQDLNIGPHQQVIFYQGAVNVDRGLEEVIKAMKFLTTDAVFVVAGTGDVFDDLKALIRNEGCENKVIMLGQIPFADLHAFTMMADIGLSVEKDIGINYHFALPNKIMDYIQANVPLLVSPLPEMKSLVERYQIGEFIDSHKPEDLATRIGSMLGNREKLDFYKKNLLAAASELCWENEEVKLIRLLEEIRQ